MPRGSPFKKNDWDAYVRDRYICQYCGLDAAKLGRHDLHVPDHLVPLAAGGPDTLDNLVVACCGCNTLKGGRFDPRQGETGVTKEELIRRAKKYIEGQRRSWESDFRQMLKEAGRG